MGGAPQASGSQVVSTMVAAHQGASPSKQPATNLSQHPSSSQAHEATTTAKAALLAIAAKPSSSGAKNQELQVAAKAALSQSELTSSCLSKMSNVVDADAIPINLIGLSSTIQHWTQKQKPRRITIHPHQRSRPSHLSHKHSSSHHLSQRPSAAANAVKGSAKSVTSSYLSKAVLDEGPTAKLHPSSNNIIIATAAHSEKPSHSSKSQLAVKRQRSALWIAKAHLLSTNSKSMAVNLSAMKKAAAIVSSHNQQKTIPQSIGTVIATTVAAKEQTPHAKTSATMHCFTSPKGAKQCNAGVPTQPSFTWQRLAERQSPPPPSSGVQLQSNSAAQQSKHRKSQQQHQNNQSARLTVEKYLKKRVGDQQAIFTKSGAATSVSNNHGAVAATKVGEVFSSLAKSVNSRASTNLEIAQIFKASASHHLSQPQRGGVGVTVQSKKKRVRLPSAKQILSSMGTHHNSAVMRSQATTSPQILISLNAQVKNSALNPAMNQSQVVRHQGKVIALPMGAKTNQRSSQSRLETFEIGHAAAVGVPMTNLLKQRNYRLPIHKLKKRLKQRMTNHSLQNLQESLLFSQLPRESRTAMRHSGRPKNTVVTSRSKSKSPTKKMMSFQAGQMKHTRAVNKRQAAIKVKKAASRLCERPSTSHDKNLFKLKGALAGSVAMRVQAMSPPVQGGKNGLFIEKQDIQDASSLIQSKTETTFEPKINQFDLNQDQKQVSNGAIGKQKEFQTVNGFLVQELNYTNSIQDGDNYKEQDSNDSQSEAVVYKLTNTNPGTNRPSKDLVIARRDLLDDRSDAMKEFEDADDDAELNLVLPVAPDAINEKGEIDLRVTEAVLQELGKYCHIQVGHDGSEEEGDSADDEAVDESRMSHRSHDNIGYVASPLLKGSSSQSKDEDNKDHSTDKLATRNRHAVEHRRAFSEHEIRSMVLSGSETFSDQEQRDDDDDFCEDEAEHSSVKDDQVDGAFDDDVDVPESDSIQYEESGEQIISKSTYNNLPIPKACIQHIKSSSQGTTDQDAVGHLHISDLQSVEKGHEFGIYDNSGTNDLLGRSSLEVSKSNDVEAAYKAIESLRNTRHLKHAAENRNKDVTELLTVSNEDAGVMSIAQEEVNSDGLRHTPEPLQVRRAKPGATFVATHTLGAPKSPSNLSVDHDIDDEEEEGDVTSGNGGDNEDLMLAVADEHQAMSQDWQRVVDKKLGH